MGQRLVVSVIENNERLATIYFHWSGYTISTYFELKTLINMLDGKTVDRTVLTREGFQKIESAKVEEEDTLLKLVRLYESLGGGLSGNEFEAFAKRYPGVAFKKDADRNNGLIDFTKEGMKDADNWAEASASINLDTREVVVEPFFCIFPEELEPDDVVTELKEDPTRFTFDDIEDRYNMICNVDTTYVKYDDEVIYGIIE